MDELALIRKAAGGDDGAFEELVLSYEKLIYNLALRMVKNPDDAFDMTQETFLKAWRAISLFRFDSKFSTWLCRIATNTCLDHLRKEKKHKVISLAQITEAGEEETNLPDHAADPAALLEAASEAETVRAALGALPAEYRAVLILRAVDGMSYDEIAEILNVSIGTVKSRIARAREKLKNEIQGNFLLQTSSKQKKGGAR